MSTVLSNLVVAGTGQQTSANSIPVVLPSDQSVTVGTVSSITSVGTIGAGEAHLGAIGGTLSSGSLQLTRPGDATPYAALDVVSSGSVSSTILTFPNMARVNGGSGYITKARVLTDQKTCVARLRLQLYHTAPAAQLDNAPFAALYVNANNRVGPIDFPAMAAEDPTTSTAAYAILVNGTGNLPLPFICDLGDKNLYGILETRDIFTPASAQLFYVELTSDAN